MDIPGNPRIFKRTEKCDFSWFFQLFIIAKKAVFSWFSLKSGILVVIRETTDFFEICGFFSQFLGAARRPGRSRLVPKKIDSDIRKNASNSCNLRSRFAFLLNLY